MNSLPVNDILPSLRETLTQIDEVVLEAPPGAGKTTLVPLSLLNEAWLEEQRIIVLEPRRLAARAAAERMAALLDEPVGATAGYRVRLDSRVGERTRIEVITQGILIRMLQEDPSLEGVGLLIFDEFHERSLDADLGLALTLEGRRLFSELRARPLKILLMSATLDGQRVAQLLDQAPVLRSEGRQFPVAVEYLGRYRPDEPIVPRVVSAVGAALQAHEGNLLVFLPGQGEIRACQQQLAERMSESLMIAPLYGSLPLDEQRRAIQAPPRGVRKVVLATPLAESSLTLEGISVVIDSGLLRQPVFDPRTGMTRLATRRISQASAAQRAGRAGRQQSGVCYRLWSEAQQRELPPYAEPEILQADLAPLVLQSLRWGATEPDSLRWLDRPPPGAWAQALDLLESLGALSAGAQGQRRLTPVGEALADMPLHPRLAHMLLRAKQLGAGSLACELAALLSERDPWPGGGSDIETRLALLRGQIRPQGGPRNVLSRLRRQYVSYLKLLGVAGEPGPEEVAPAVLLAFAFPDRIARRREGAMARYRLSNGRAASLKADDPLVGREWLVVAELGGREGASEDTVYLAAELPAAAFDGPLSEQVREQAVAHWDTQRGRFVAERQFHLGCLLFHREALPMPDGEARQEALLNLIREQGLATLNWSPSARQLQARVILLRRLDVPPGEWPDFEEPALLANLEQWLGPFVSEIHSLQDLQRLDITGLLRNCLSWPQQQALEEAAPTHIQVPSGSRIGLDYCHTPPLLAVKLQEMFGCQETPAVAGGRQPLMVHLLSPARRPLQVTQDLAGFWRGAYQQVKREMKGRYPKHPWPDDPLQAPATAKTKRVGG